jgi:hypothetical protein
MRTRSSRRRAVGRLGVVIAGAALAIAGSRRAEGDPAPLDGAPKGAVAFFAGTSCPPGWVAAADAQGRLLAGVTEGKDVGVTVGEPLADSEDRTHNHAWSGDVTLAYKSVSAADGPNQSGAAAQAYTITGVTEPAVSGLGFAQVLVCERP